MSYTPDRRPIKVVRAYNGAAASPRGYAPGMRSTAEWRVNLFGALDRAYALGFRRFCLYVPAGRPAGQTLFRLQQWHMMPDGVRDVLSWGMPSWLAAHPDTTLFPYLGIDMSPNRDWHAPASSVVFADHTDPDKHAEFMAAILPWLALAPQPGAVGIGLDNSTKIVSVPELRYYAELLRDMGSWVMGEALLDTKNTTDPPGPLGPAYPFDDLIYDVPQWAVMGPSTGNNGYLVNYSVPYRAGWALDPSVPNYDEETYPTMGWSFDPETTEAIALVQNGHLTSVEQAEAWVARGYVLASQSDLQDAFVLGGHGITPGEIPDPLPDPPATTTPATETASTITFVGGALEIDGVAIVTNGDDFGADVNSALATLDTDAYHRIVLRGEHDSATAIALTGFTAGLDVDATGLRLLWSGEGAPLVMTGCPGVAIYGGRYRRLGESSDRRRLWEA